MNMTTSTSTPKPALVFGASGEQGRAVMEGLVEAGGGGIYGPVYGFTRSSSCDSDGNRDEWTYLRDALGCELWKGDVSDPDDVRRALLETRAQVIFLVTTTDLPTEVGQTTGCWNAMEEEYQAIQLFVDTLQEVYEQDQVTRHLVFSTKDNVQKLCHSHTKEHPELANIAPMDDGSIVPHYSAKGRGAEYALERLRDHPGITLTLLTLPFVYSNFWGFFTPLPVETEGSVNQWSISASLGDGGNPIDMMSVSDLSTIVPNIFQQSDKYRNENIRLSACRISMDEIAAAFSDLFGKDVIYNPLLPEEVAALPFPSAPAMAQMCHYLQFAVPHSLEQTQQIMFPHKKPQTFYDWLLTHSDSTAFARVGLDVDAPDITSVVVFGATGPQGTSVVKGLLKDTRKRYTVRATTRHVDSDAARALRALDPERVTVVYADFDNVDSCREAAEGVDGAFLVTDFYVEANRNMEAEERHAKNVIDACEASKSIKHLVFSTMDNVEEMNAHMDLGLNSVTDNQGQEAVVVQMNAKAKAAAYARTKKLSVTYVILPCYSEMFLDMIQRKPVAPSTSGEEQTTGSNASTAASTTSNGDDNKTEKLVLTVPLKNNDKVMCMSVDDLGPAVSNIFDSYQVYAGHEIGLVTDFVTVSEIKDMLNSVLVEEGNTTTRIETESVTKEEWVEMKAGDTYMKDMGQMFAYLSHTDAVRKRHSIAKTMKLVPSARPLKLWVEQNKDNPAFREKLGLR